MLQRNQEQKDISDEVYERLMGTEMHLRSSETESDLL